MLKEMIVEKGRKYGTFISPLLYLICSVITVFSTVGQVTAPLLCAVAGAANPIGATAVAAGGILSYLIFGDIYNSGFIICSLILITAGKWIMREDINSKMAVFITAVSMSFSGIVFGLLVMEGISSAAENLIYAGISSVAAYFITLSMEILSSPKNIIADRKTLTSLAVFFILITAILSGMSISVLNVGVILSGLVLLCACRFFGCIGGVICGVLSTAGLFIGNPELGTQTAFFGAAGLAAGFFSRYSRVTVASAFSGTILLGQLTIGMNDMSFCVQADVVISGICFMFIPERLVTMGGRFCSGAIRESGEFLGKEMEFAAKSLTDVRKSVMDIISVFESRQKKYGNVERVSDRICGKCRNKLECWEKNFENTNYIFHKMEKGKNDIFPMGLECINKKKILDEFEKCRREDGFSKMLSSRLNESRNFLFSQMEASEDIVSSLSEKINVNVSKSMTSTLCRTLDRYGAVYLSAIAYYNNEKRLIAEIYVTEDEEYDIQQLCELLSHELSIDFECSKPFISGGEVRIRFNQQTQYTVELEKYQISADEKDVSGDTCGYFTDGLGFGYAFLSDGMGQGSKAAADSQLTAALFKRLIRLGMSCEGAVKMINSVLLARSGDESFATLDIAKINLETGGVTLCKSGASSTLIKYGDSVMMFSFASNPIGIIHNIHSSVKECDFSEENVLVMTSDGVPESAYMYIKEKLLQDISLGELSEQICSYSKKITAGSQSDDITAMSIKLIKNVKNRLIDTQNDAI